MKLLSLALFLSSYQAQLHLFIQRKYKLIWWYKNSSTMKRGPKPRLITEECLNKVEHLAARGLSQQQVCDALGFSETWWYDAKQKESVNRNINNNLFQLIPNCSQVFSCNGNWPQAGILADWYHNAGWQSFCGECYHRTSTIGIRAFSKSSFGRCLMRVAAIRITSL